MDTKKKIALRRLQLFLWAFLVSLTSASAQTVNRNVQFCGCDYSYESDSITIKFNLLADNGEHIRNLPDRVLSDNLHIFEDGREAGGGMYKALSGGIRIPKDYTISVLVDLGIDEKGKQSIFEAVKDLVFSAPDSCIYLSFFGDEVTTSEVVTASNYESFHNRFLQSSNNKYFFSALYPKLLEFNEREVGQPSEFRFEPRISRRASEGGKTAMFVFVDGSRPADNGDPTKYLDLTEGAKSVKNLQVKPTIYAFYYSSGKQLDDDVDLTLDGITGHSQKMDFPDGRYVSTEDRQKILDKIGEAIEDQKCDYSYTYKVGSNASYQGPVEFSAQWVDELIGEPVKYIIGSNENPWPKRGDWLLKFFIAILATFFMAAFFFFIMKIVVPTVKSRVFAIKYYKKYQPEYGVQKRTCTFCRQEVEPGQLVVVKCKHLMHVKCWKEIGYHCAEYGQNCNTGTQAHVDWPTLFTKHSFRDCHHAFSGILAGFFSWIAYELLGRELFPSLAAGIAKTFLTGEQHDRLMHACTSKVASFMAIGLLLGLFLSLVFRWNEEYRRKDSQVFFRIIGFSLLSSLIGFMAFAFGGIILCMMVSLINQPDIPWYCSLPAYLLFSVCVPLSLTIKTSIPIKSAMLGGLCSAGIGFLVLYFANGIVHRFPWMNMLFDFIIYGGGLGASIVTMRKLAEKYFLVIKNGPKAGTRIPIHKWMNATGGGNKVTIGMTGDCEIQMNWEKSNKVAKEHAVLYIDHTKNCPVIKPLQTKVTYNSRVELPVRRPAPLSNRDTFKIGDTIFQYEEDD